MPTLDTAPLLQDLNDAQRAAAAHPPAAGPLLIVAGAGTGKTQTLATRLAWLAAQGLDPQRLLLLTFSRRAAGEMTHRAGRLLHRALGLPAGTAAPRLPWAGTFHAIGARLLRAHAAELGLPPGFTVLDRADAQDLLALVRQQRGLAETEGTHRFPLAPTCAAILSRVVNTGRPLGELLAEQWPWCSRFEDRLMTLFGAYADAKRQQQSLDFDDLLQAWWHLMQQPALAAAVSGRFDHVLVDELQDVNQLQADLLQALARHGCGITAVGDDAQSIYGFRGASVRHILGFAAQFQPPAAQVALEQNYRSSPEILAASNAVIDLAAERLPKTLWTARSAAGKPQLHTVADELAQARGVADAVLAAREQGLALKRQAVLFRTATHSLALELELVRRQIPFVKFGGLKFLEAAHVKDVLAVLRWADNPASQLSALRSARLVPGLGPASVQRLLAHHGPLATFKPAASATAAWPALCQLVEHLRSPLAAWPDDLQRVIDWYRPHCERLHADARVRLDDLAQLARMAAGHGSRERFITELTLDPPQSSSDEAGPPHRDEDYLVLSTIHSAKGQEWRAVHVLNVTDGGIPADLATGTSADIEEERRLLYVAMTRAQDHLHLWVPQRYHVVEQRAWGDQHLYALRSRFLPDSLLPWFDDVVAPPSQNPQPAPEAPAAPRPPGPPLLDLGAALGQRWRRKD